MYWLQGIALSLLATVAFSILSNVPVRILLASGLVGMTGWLILNLMPLVGAYPALSLFVAATGISLLSQLLSIRLRVPSTNFSVAGIIPLVPGSSAYRAMLAFVNGDNVEGLSLGVQTSTKAGAIAAGLILGLSIFKVWKGFVARYAGKREAAD